MRFTMEGLRLCNVRTDEIRNGRLVDRLLANIRLTPLRTRIGRGKNSRVVDVVQVELEHEKGETGREMYIRFEINKEELERLLSQYDNIVNSDEDTL